MIESSGRTKGERGVLSEKMFRDFCKEGSLKEGDIAGLRGGVSYVEGPLFGKGGKSSAVNKGGGSATSRGQGDEGEELGRTSIRFKVGGGSGAKEGLIGAGSKKANFEGTTGSFSTERLHD